MVLLTSSAISVAISSSVVCTFTFLLFLSGYVLQQQTVRSLQQALRQPPEPRLKATLPAAFQTAVLSEDGWIPRASESAATSDLDAIEVAVQLGRSTYAEQNGVESGEERDLILEAFAQRQTASQEQRRPPAVSLVHNGPQTRIVRDRMQSIVEHPKGDKAHTKAEDLKQVSDSSDDGAMDTSFSTTHAYLLPLFHPSLLCAALLFSETHRRHTTLPPQHRPPIIVLYPSTWETNPTLDTNAAINLLRTTVDNPENQHSRIILHPVPISTIWSGPGMVDAQLLAEVQRHYWSFDRLLYLRLPGMAIDIPTLDLALTSSDLRRSWVSLKSSLSDSATASLNSISPPILLVTPHHDTRLLSPRPSLRSRLTLSLSSDHSNRHQNEMDVEAKAASKAAAWVIFDEEELEHRRQEKEWYGGIVARFEREQKAVCKDSGLL